MSLAVTRVFEKPKTDRRRGNFSAGFRGDSLYVVMIPSIFSLYHVQVCDALIVLTAAGSKVPVTEGFNKAARLTVALDRDSVGYLTRLS